MAAADGSGMMHLPGHFLPFEEIALPPHLMPVNPEDEDDVVPDMHAAFGINRALGQNQAALPAGVAAAGGANLRAAGGAGGVGEPGGEASMAGAQREPAWRDLGIEGLVAEGGHGHGHGHGDTTGVRREGRRTGVLLMR